MSWVGYKGYAGVKDLRRRNEQFVLKNHLRTTGGDLVSLDDLRNSKAFKDLERTEQRKYERAAKDGAVLSETEGNAIINPDTGRMTDDFALQDPTLDSADRLDRALTSQDMKEKADAYNKAQADADAKARGQNDTPTDQPPEQERSRTSGEGGVDEPYMNQQSFENATAEEADLLLSEIEQFYPSQPAKAGN